MKELLNKLSDIEKKTSFERGEYNLFALFLRENSSNKWDVLVAADWITKDKAEDLKYLGGNIQNGLTKDELLLIARIVIIEENNPALPALQQARKLEHGTAELKEFTFFGLQIKHAFLITSNRKQAA